MRPSQWHFTFLAVSNVQLLFAFVRPIDLSVTTGYLVEPIEIVYLMELLSLSQSSKLILQPLEKVPDMIIKILKFEGGERNYIWNTLSLACPLTYHASAYFPGLLKFIKFWFVLVETSLKPISHCFFAKNGFPAGWECHHYKVNMKKQTVQRFHCLLLGTFFFNKVTL